MFSQINPEYRIYKRFASISDASWNVGKGSWSAIIFKAKRDVLIYGVGITEPNDREQHNFKYCYKYIIKEEDKQLRKSEKFIEEV